MVSGKIRNDSITSGNLSIGSSISRDRARGRASSPALRNLTPNILIPVDQDARLEAIERQLNDYNRQFDLILDRLSIVRPVPSNNTANLTTARNPQNGQFDDIEEEQLDDDYEGDDESYEIIQRHRRNAVHNSAGLGHAFTPFPRISSSVPSHTPTAANRNNVSTGVGRSQESTDPRADRDSIEREYRHVHFQQELETNNPRADNTRNLNAGRTNQNTGTITDRQTIQFRTI